VFLEHYTQGFVLGEKNIGEGDQVFTVYTRDFGKIGILGKAIRNINSKLKAGINLFYFVEIGFVQGRVQKTLISAFALNKYRNLRQSILKFRLAKRFAKTFQELTRNGQSDEAVWELIGQFFFQLNLLKLSLRSWVAFYYFFVWRLVKILGFCPGIKQCVVCGRKQGWLQNFDSLAGGLVCQNCLKLRSREAARISKETIVFLNLVFSGNWPAIEKAEIINTVFKDLQVITKQYLNHLKSRTKL